MIEYGRNNNSLPLVEFKVTNALPCMDMYSSFSYDKGYAHFFQKNEFNNPNREYQFNIFEYKSKDINAFEGGCTFNWNADTYLDH